MGHVFLVFGNIERYEPYNKTHNVIAVCGSKEAALREARLFIAQSHRIAIMTHGNEKDFYYFSTIPAEEHYIFTPSATIGDVVYYEAYTYSGTKDYKWSVSIEEHTIRE